MTREEVYQWVEVHGARRVVEMLRPYVTESRQARIDAVLSQRIASVQVAVESPSDPHNAAAVVRTCEALGALSVHVIAAEGDALHAPAVTQGAFHWMHTYHHVDLEAFLVHLGGLEVVGACLDGNVELDQVRVERPLCILLGNESRGLSAEARRACTTRYRIPMMGMSESLNLSVSAAISLYSILGRRRRFLGGSGDLRPEERERERAWCYARSVDPRLLAALPRR